MATQAIDATILRLHTPISQNAQVFQDLFFSGNATVRSSCIRIYF